MEEAKGNSGVLPVMFIGGIGRSGTTIFELSLATDERVVSLGEVVHIWQRSLMDDELCGCGVNFSQCPFWMEVGQRAFGGWDRVDPERAIYLKARVDRTIRVPQVATKVGSHKWLMEYREYADLYDRIYRAARDVSGSPVVIDSSKQASMAYVLQGIPGIRLSVVHCVRDSRAVAYSWMRQVVRPEAQSEGTSLMTRYSPSVLALKWLQHNFVVEGMRMKGVPVFRMRYEDWILDPSEAVKAALKSAGLPVLANASLGDSWVDLGVSHTCSGNPMRFKRGRVEIVADMAWQEKLPRRSRLLVEAITSPGLLAYGYSRKFR